MAFEEPELGGAAEQAIGPYLHAVRRRWRLVALITLIAVGIAVITVERTGGSYSASASILVTPLPQGDPGFVGIGTVVETGDPARTVQTAAALIDTPDAAAAAAKRLGRPWTAQSVLQAVAVTPRGASDVLAVTGQATSPGSAQRLANVFAEAAVGYRAAVVQAQILASITQLETRLTALRAAPASSPEPATLATAIEQLRAVQGTGREPTLSVSQTAGSATQNGASRALILLLAIVGGFALGSIAALGVETFGAPVRDREEITKLYPAPVLAVLESIGGRRKRHGIPPWLLPPSVFEQLRMLRVQLSLATGGPVIMVTSAGAGDGNTTVAAALAAAFAQAGKEVALIDLDLRKPDLPKLLGLGFDSRASSGKQEPLGPSLAVPELPGVRVMTAPTGNIEDFETLVDRLPLLLDDAKGISDIVIIDTAPVGEVSEALRISPLCDQIVFVARPRHTDRRRLVLARDLLLRAGSPLGGLVLVGKETGLPRSDQSYEYAMKLPIQNGKSSRRGSSNEAPVPADRDRELQAHLSGLVGPGRARKQK